MASETGESDGNGQGSSGQLVARTGRERQRYAEDGERLIAGCVCVWRPGSPSPSRTVPRQWGGRSGSPADRIPPADVFPSGT